MLPKAILSSDSHIIEPPDLWTSRMPKRLHGSAPHLVHEKTADWWHLQDTRLFSVTGGTEVGKRFDDMSNLRMESRYKDVRPGGYDPRAKLKDMDLDGVWGEVIYPTLGLTLWRVRDGKLLSLVSRYYNDWVADFIAADSKRLRAVAMINLDSVAEGVKELERCAALGLSGAMISVYQFGRTYALPGFERFWAAAAETGMPVSLHVGTNRTIPETQRMSADTRVSPQNPFQSQSSYVTAAHWVELSLADMIFAGVFERHPKLRVLSLEHEAAWAVHFLNAMDYTYTQRMQRTDWIRLKDGALPSDFYRRNVSISIQEDATALRLRDLIGVDNLSWGSDYPHLESTFPRSASITVSSR